MVGKKSGVQKNIFVGYARVSTLEQAAEGVSLESQVSTMRAYATMRGLELAEIIIDAGVSGSIPLEDRPGGKRLVAATGRKIAGVIAVRLDRLFRDASNCLSVTNSWDKSGVALHLIDLGGQSIDTSSAMGRMFLTMSAAFAELERNLIRERTKAGMEQKKANGERYSRFTPLGKVLLEDGVTLANEPQEQAIIGLARQLHNDGLSLRKIAEELNKQGHTNRAGGKFSKTQIVRMVAA